MRGIAPSLALIVTASAAPALDSCLVGTWQADLNDLAAIMATQMQGSATPVGGRVMMDITPDGRANMNVDNLVLNVVVPSVPPMDVGVSGVSNGNLVADGGRWTITSGTYSLVGSANVMGQTMTIPFDSATGLLGGGSGSYTCSGNSLGFESDGSQERMPRRWSRAG